MLELRLLEGSVHHDEERGVDRGGSSAAVRKQREILAFNKVPPFSSRISAWPKHMGVYYGCIQHGLLTFRYSSLEMLHRHIQVLAPPPPHPHPHLLVILNPVMLTMKTIILNKHLLLAYQQLCLQ